MGPPCSGKSTFVRNQEKKEWIDSDDLFNELNVKWHFNETNNNNFKLNYLRCDYILEQCKVNNMKVIGALFWDYKPICIVIPKYETHLKYIKKRNMNIDYVIKIRNFLIQKAQKEKIQIFKTCEEAHIFVKKLESKNIINHSYL